MPQAECMWFAEWLNKWLDIVSRILKNNRKCFSFMAQNLLHILSSWLLLPQHTFKNINQEECFPHVFPPLSFFLLWNSNSIVLLLLCRACTQPWPRQRKDQIRETVLLAAGGGVGSEVGTSSSPSGTSFPSLFFSTSWDCATVTSMGDPRSGLSCNCCLTLVSLKIKGP